jgi:hypothetical protein
MRPAHRGFLFALAAVAYGLFFVRRLDSPLGSLDIDAAWSAGRALLAHQNPYETIGPTGVYHYAWVFVYPLTLGAVALPLALLPLEIARAAFLILAAGVFGYAIGATRPWAWPLILSYPFTNAVNIVQWSPFFAASLIFPAFGVVAAVKPNLALALLAGARSRRHVMAIIGGGIALTAISLAFRPSWPVEWYHRASNASSGFDPFLFRPGGFLILAAALRWRDPDARLLLALGLVPQTGIWYEALPALLVARTYRQAAILTILSIVAWMASGWINVSTFTTARHNIGTLILWSILLPATLMVLMRGVGWRVWLERAEEAKTPRHQG